MTDSFLLIKLVHILSATLLFGAGLGTAFFMWRCHRSNDIAAIAVVTRSVVLADSTFIMPAILILPVTGYLMIEYMGYSLYTPWIFWSFGLYLLVVACWLPVVWLQMKMRDLAAVAIENNEALPATFGLYFRIWTRLGYPAFVSALIVFALMVFRPL
ncbi:MAG TPA: DUF2269 domain-containing protein [Acidiferrobacteraceae bacterium]|nr:DUF2269 domain-containing protein [Acidiferrobacteraceae bacterium]